MELKEFRNEHFERPMRFDEPISLRFIGCTFAAIANTDETTVDFIKMKSGRIEMLGCTFFGLRGKAIRAFRASSREDDSFIGGWIRNCDFLNGQLLEKEHSKGDMDWIVLQSIERCESFKIMHNRFWNEDPDSRIGRCVKLQGISNVEFSYNTVDVPWIKSGVVSPQLNSQALHFHRNSIRTHANDFVCGGCDDLVFERNAIELLGEKNQDVIDLKDDVTEITVRQNIITAREFTEIRRPNKAGNIIRS